MPVGSYCRRALCVLEAGDTLRSAAQHMQKEEVGSLVVIDEQGRPMGVVTDRDVALRVVAGRLDPDVTRARDALTRPAVTIGADAPLGEATSLMSGKRLRRIPVVDEQGVAVGLLSLDDVVQLLADEITGLARVAGAQLPVGASAGAVGAGAAAAGVEAQVPREARPVEHYRRDVVYLRSDADVRALAELMEREAVGCVVATDDGTDVAGVVTDRDLVVRVVATGLDPDATPVSAVMSAPAVTVDTREPLEAVVQKMRRHGVRRIPVVSDGAAVGLVSYDDLLVTFGRELAQLGETARREVGGEQRSAQLARARDALESNLRELGTRAGELGDTALEKLRRELEPLWERLRRR